MVKDMVRRRESGSLTGACPSSNLGGCNMTRKLVDFDDFQFTIDKNGLNLEFINPEWEEIEDED